MAVGRVETPALTDFELCVSVHDKREHGHEAPPSAAGVPGLPRGPGQEAARRAGRSGGAGPRPQCASHGLVAPAVPHVLIRLDHRPRRPASAITNHSAPSSLLCSVGLFCSRPARILGSRQACCGVGVEVAL